MCRFCQGIALKSLAKKQPLVYVKFQRNDINQSFKKYGKPPIPEKKDQCETAS